MAPLAGVTGLYGPPEGPHGQTGRDPSNWGGPADRRHAIPGDSSHERPYGGTSYGQDAELPAEVIYGAPTGEQGDMTPNVHSAPYPAGITHDPLVAAEQMRLLHGRDLGALDVLEDGIPYPVHVDSGRYDSPNQSILARQTAGQLRSGPGSTDVDQGDGTEQGYGFAFGHQFRRWFGDPVPRDWSTLNAGERPFYSKHPVWQARFDGPDSPYYGAGDTSIDMAMGDTPVGYATPYLQPPNPTMAATTEQTSEAPVIDNGWVAG